MPKSIIGAWRAFSLTKQLNVSTAKTVNTTLNFEGDPMAPSADKFYLNDDEVTGELFPTQKRLLTKKFAGKHKTKLFPHVVGLLASQAMGRDTSTVVGATTAYRHKLEVDKDVVELPYRTMIEYDGNEQLIFRGVTCSGFKIMAKRGEMAEFEADLLGAGYEATDATAKPARVAESYMSYQEADLFKGGTYDGTTVTGGTSLKAIVENFTFTFANGASAVYLMGDSTGNAGEVRRGAKYTATLDVDLEIIDSTHRNAFLAGDEFVMRVPFVGGVANGSANYTVELVFPRVCIADATKGNNSGINLLKQKLQVLSDATHGPFVINIINLQSASYLAA